MEETKHSWKSSQDLRKKYSQNIMRSQEPQACHHDNLSKTTWMIHDSYSKNALWTDEMKVKFMA